MSYEAIRYAVEGGVATITLNRPDKLNSFNAQMNKELADALKQAEKDAAVRCLVLTGEGRGFCAGQDLAAVGDIALSDLIRQRYIPVIMKLRTLEKPVIAAVNGVAAGAGVSLALACDLVIMSEKAAMIQAFVKVGLVPDCGGSYMLPRLVGYHKAMELALLGDKVTAQEALALGLCNRVAPEAEFAKVVGDLAARLAKGPKSMGLIKRQISRGMDQSMEEILELEAYLQDVANNTADAKEAIGAFLEKREPNFTGR